ncbi:LamG-like jellyroll fold domain-containing protein [Flavobacterium sp. ASV13]|uniref:LamG-like jellyroll fold domain-containing protein n=1 Tax=Flavobacterium sp. ASV13 TaxID=1506583 RepID=UPI00055995F9|nr:LamG-like jellyroll fold domain-containing protein [Flavobacterium sp. ASV13]
MGNLKKYFFGRQKNQDLNIGLVAYYQFDTDANASVGGVNGTLTNSPTFTTGKMGNAIDFLNDTTLRYCQLADNNIFSFTDGSGNDIPFSMSFWIYVHAFSSQFNTIIVKRLNTATDDEYQCDFVSTSISFYKFSSNVAYKRCQTNYAFSTSTWYHIVITDDGTKTTGGMRVYINSVLQSSTFSFNSTYTGMPNGTGSVRLGSTNVNGTEARKHKGKLDALGIWKNRMLNQNAVNLLYNSGTGRTYPF